MHDTNQNRTRYIESKRTGDINNPQFPYNIEIFFHKSKQKYDCGNSKDKLSHLPSKLQTHKLKKHAYPLQSDVT